MSIPEDWHYEIVGWFGKKYPLAWIVEGTGTIQCLCPNCDYAQGYNEPFIAASFKKKLLKCNKCGTEFIGLV